MFVFDLVHFNWPAIIVRMKNLANTLWVPCWLYQIYGAKFFFLQLIKTAVCGQMAFSEISRNTKWKPYWEGPPREGGIEASVMTAGFAAHKEVP